MPLAVFITDMDNCCFITKSPTKNKQCMFSFKHSGLCGAAAYLAVTV